MTHIVYAPIDRQFGCLERDLPNGAFFNGVDPLPDITFGFALASRYPLPPGEPDIRYGTVEGKVTNNPSILLRSITKAEYDAAYAAEMQAREPKPAPVPETVSMRQAKIQLSRVGKLKAANDAIAAMTGQAGEEARIEWEYAVALRRDHPLVAGLGQVLGLTGAAIDDLFRDAAAIA